MKNLTALQEIQGFAKPIQTRFKPLFQKIQAVVKSIEINTPTELMAPFNRGSFVSKDLALNVQSLINLSGEKRKILFLEKMFIAIIFFGNIEAEIQLPAGINDFDVSNPRDTVKDLNKYLKEFNFVFKHNGSNSLYLMVTLTKKKSKLSLIINKFLKK